MTKLWLRSELFEHGVLHFPSRFMHAFTAANLALAISELRVNEAQVVGFQAWRDVAHGLLGWTDIETTSFWQMLRFLHASQPMAVDNVETTDKSAIVTEDTIPLYKLVIFLFIHIDKTAKAKGTIDEFDAVWYLKDPNERLSGVRGSTPCTPQSPTSSPILGMKEKPLADAHHIVFFKENCADLAKCLFDKAEIISPDQLDQLGFLIGGGTRLLTQARALSDLCPLWGRAEQEEKEQRPVTEVMEWIKGHLTVNESIYPPFGSEEVAFEDTQTGSVDLQSSEEVPINRPMVIHGLQKTTAIKTSANFPGGAVTDTVITSCHNSYIYIVSPARYTSVVACSNCQLVLGPNSGVLTVDRCENLHLTAACGQLHLSNCLDCVFNLYTPNRPILTGDNKFLHLGPFNTTYPKLLEHLRLVRMDGDYSFGKVFDFLNLFTQDETETSEKEAITRQPPSTFQQVEIPVQMDGDTKMCPFELPEEYESVVKDRARVIDDLQRQLSSDDFEQGFLRSINLGIQAHFKEWLVSSGNMRQVLDLVNLNRAADS